jgi:hypothetical protein
LRGLDPVRRGDGEAKQDFAEGDEIVHGRQA